MNIQRISNGPISEPPGGANATAKPGTFAAEPSQAAHDAVPLHAALAENSIAPISATAAENTRRTQVAVERAFEEVFGTPPPKAIAAELMASFSSNPHLRALAERCAQFSE